MLQEFPVFDIRMTNGPIGEEGSRSVESGGFYQEGCNGTVNIRFTDHGNADFIEHGIGCTGHDAEFTLEGVPTLDGTGITAVFFHQPFHGYVQTGHIFDFVIFNADIHVGADVGDGLVNFRLFGFGLGDGFCQFRHRNRSQLNVELF